MLKRVFSAALFILLLTSMLTLAFDVQPVRASGTIYIRADGSIDPPTAPISTVDNVTYTFTGDINDSIVIERDNIVVNGAGYSLRGTRTLGSIGTDVTGRSNITIKNMTIEAFYYGIYLESSSGNSISGNNITNNYSGIVLGYSSGYNSISGNNITANSEGGIHLDSFSPYSFSGYNSISGNNVTANNHYGVLLYSSSSNSISANSITANTGIGIWLDYSGSLVGDSSGYNSISGNNVTANNDYGIVLISSSSSTVSGNDITDNWRGILIYTSSSNSISGNNITNSEKGIYLHYSSSNSIFHNNLINNTQQVYSDNSVNVWDNNYPSGGNHWSDYNGTDLYSGPYQNETGSDGIGDTQYTIDTINIDGYPLVNPYGFVSGDINLDRIVDISDAILAALAFGSYPGHPNWNSQADLNNDNIIDILDLIILASNFGKH